MHREAASLGSPLGPCACGLAGGKGGVRVREGGGWGLGCEAGLRPGLERGIGGREAGAMSMALGRCSARASEGPCV